MKKFLLTILLLVAVSLPAFAGADFPGGGTDSETESQQWLTVNEYHETHVYPTTVVNAKTKPCPDKYRGKVKEYKDAGIVSGDGTVDPAKDTRPVSKWEQSLALGRNVEKQGKVDQAQNDEIGRKLGSQEFSEYTKDQGQLDSDQTNAIIENRSNIFNNIWIVWIGALFAGLALTIVFIALRWFIPATIVGLITLMAMIIISVVTTNLLMGIFTGIIALISIGVIMWYVLPQLQGRPLGIPTAAAYGPITRT